MSENHQAWKRKVEEEAKQLREQRMDAIVRVDELQQRLRVSEQTMEAAELRLTKELVALEQRQNIKEKEIIYHIGNAEEAHSKSIQELRDLLTAQYKLGAKSVESNTKMTNIFDFNLFVCLFVWLVGCCSFNFIH